MQALYAACLLQGICLVTFPAISTLLTNPRTYDFSNALYGSLFIPEAVLSMMAAFLSPKIANRFGHKKVFLAGVLANLLSMALLCLSVLFVTEKAAAFSAIFLATASLGLGFGLLVPTLNATATLLYPANTNEKLLLLNALLGLGTALSPLSVSAFLSFSAWWQLPGSLALLFGLLFLFTLPLQFPEIPQASVPSEKTPLSIPTRFWLFALFALLYGIIETLSANWMGIYMRKAMAASFYQQSLALTAFWGMVTLGRLLFSFGVLKDKSAFQITPFLTAIAFWIIAHLSKNGSVYAIFAFGLAGFGCSVLLPLCMSFAAKQLKAIAPSLPGKIIALYLLGYGIASFGVGPMEDSAHLTLQIIYEGGVLIACILGVLAYQICHPQKHPVS